MQTLNDLEARAAELHRKAELYRQRKGLVGSLQTSALATGSNNAYASGGVYGPTGQLTTSGVVHSPATPITAAAVAAFGRGATAPSSTTPSLAFGGLASPSAASPAAVASTTFAATTHNLMQGNPSRSLGRAQSITGGQVGTANIVTQQFSTPSHHQQQHPHNFAQSPFVSPSVPHQQPHLHQQQPPAFHTADAVAPAVLSSELAAFLGMSVPRDPTTATPLSTTHEQLFNVHEAAQRVAALLDEEQRLQQQLAKTQEQLRGYRRFLQEVSLGSAQGHAAVAEAVEAAMAQPTTTAFGSERPNAPSGAQTFAPSSFPPRAGTPSSLNPVRAFASASPPRDVRHTVSAFGDYRQSSPAANTSPALAAGTVGAYQYSPAAMSPTSAPSGGGGGGLYHQRHSNPTPFNPSDIIEEVQAIARAREARDALRRQQNAYSPTSLSAASMY